MSKILISWLTNGVGLDIPTYATAGSAGLDICSAEDIELAPGDRKLVSTGFAIAIPEGFEGQIRPRSGLAIKHGLTVINAPGTIDADYRGEIKVPLINLGQEIVSFERGARIAQLVISEVTRVEFSVVDELGNTGRNVGGFGSTGV
ncbi:MAG: dUTP diphosphatase [Alphaproteobacteria bacterium]